MAWHIDTPCSFVGLFVEALPVLMALDGLGVRLSLHLASACNSTFLDTKLSPEQAAFIRRVQAPPSRNFRSVNERSVIKQSDDGYPSTHTYLRVFAGVRGPTVGRTAVRSVRPASWIIIVYQKFPNMK